MSAKQEFEIVEEILSRMMTEVERKLEKKTSSKWQASFLFDADTFTVTVRAQTVTGASIAFSVQQPMSQITPNVSASGVVDRIVQAVMTNIRNTSEES